MSVDPRIWDPLTVVLLTEPRTGSHWLTAVFHSQGFGAPGVGHSWELFDRRQHRFPPLRTLGEAVVHIRRTIDHCRVEGRAVVKVMFDQVEDFLGHIGLTTDAVPDLLIEAFPNPRFVRLRRLDYIAQVVSLFIARRSGSFLCTDPVVEGGIPSYDFDAILEHYDTLRPHIRRCFDRAEDLLNPKTVFYEDLCDYPDVSSERLSSLVNREIRVGHPTFVQRLTADSRIKEAYANRFRRDLQVRGRDQARAAAFLKVRAT